VHISFLKAIRTWLSRQVIIARIAAIGSTLLAPYRAMARTTSWHQLVVRESADGHANDPLHGHRHYAVATELYRDHLYEALSKWFLDRY
jgi:hypothetical protein